MMQRFILFGALICLPVFGSVLSFEGTPSTTITSEGVRVPVYSKAKITLADGTETPMHLTGAGIYAKPVAFMNVNVYIATSYIDNADGINPQDPMDSIRKARVQAMQMTILRSLSPQQIRNSYEDALSVNHVDLNDPDIQAALDKIDFSLQKGQVSTLVGYPNGQDEDLLLEIPAWTKVTTGDALADTFWLSWFGVSADSGLAALKRKLIGN